MVPVKEETPLRQTGNSIVIGLVFAMHADHLYQHHLQSLFQDAEAEACQVDSSNLSSTTYRIYCYKLGFHEHYGNFFYLTDNIGPVCSSFPTANRARWYRTTIPSYNVVRIPASAPFIEPFDHNLSTIGKKGLYRSNCAIGHELDSLDKLHKVVDTPR